jgi:homoserine acetyltransferase
MVDENNAYSFTTSATQQITLGLGSEGFKMWRGGRLAEVSLAYETWGELNDAKDNAVLIFGGLSPSACQRPRETR